MTTKSLIRKPVSSQVVNHDTFNRDIQTPFNERAIIKYEDKRKLDLSKKRDNRRLFFIKKTYNDNRTFNNYNQNITPAVKGDDDSSSIMMLFMLPFKLVESFFSLLISRSNNNEGMLDFLTKKGRARIKRRNLRIKLKKIKEI